VPVVEGAQRTPGRVVALDCITEVDRGEIDAAGNRRGCVGLLVLPPKRDELIFGYCQETEAM